MRAVHCGCRSRGSSPLALVSGRAALDVTPQGEIVASGDSVALRNVRIDAPARALDALAARGIAPAFGGDLRLEAAAFRYDGRAGDGAVDLRWDRARVAFNGAVVDLGTIVARVMPRGGDLFGHVHRHGRRAALDGRRRARQWRIRNHRHAHARGALAARAHAADGRPGTRRRERRDTRRMARRAALRATAARVPGVDALRAIALVAMIGYHFAFDLRYYGVIRTDFEHDPVCIAIRTAILSSFLLLAGVSLVLADRAAVSPARFWRHVATIAGCALLVSAGSYALFPRTFIWFGVLHAIAIALVLARPCVRRPALAAAIGVAVIVAGLTFQHAAFDRYALGWIGFMTAKPYTEDYVPLFPWMGAVFLGVALGHVLARRDFAALAPLAGAPRWLTAPGRHTLLIYMVHQPLLLGALWLALKR